VDVEVVGDDLYVQEPKDEQRESGHADECEHDQDEARESVVREVSRATWLAPALLRAVRWPSDQDMRPASAARSRSLVGDARRHRRTRPASQ
jgi:hypothetical protein